jgi:hypothetical protein
MHYCYLVLIIVPCINRAKLPPRYCCLLQQVLESKDNVSATVVQISAAITDATTPATAAAVEAACPYQQQSQQQQCSTVSPWYALPEPLMQPPSKRPRCDG